MILITILGQTSSIFLQTKTVTVTYGETSTQSNGEIMMAGNVKFNVEIKVKCSARSGRLMKLCFDVIDFSQFYICW